MTSVGTDTAAYISSERDDQPNYLITGATPVLDTSFPLPRCDNPWSMGCVKSKRGELSEEKANSAGTSDGPAQGRSRGEKAYLVHAETGGAVDPESPTTRVNPVLLEYAQRLSEEIVSRAVQQWADVDSRYSDIPYIECDVP